MHLEPFLDEVSWERSVKRSQVLEELVDSEESYLSDLKALLNVRNAKASCRVCLHIDSGLQYIASIDARTLEEQHSPDTKKRE